MRPFATPSLLIYVVNPRSLQLPSDGTRRIDLLPGTSAALLPHQKIRDGIAEMAFIRPYKPSDFEAIAHIVSTTPQLPQLFPA